MGTIREERQDERRNSTFRYFGDIFAPGNGPVISRRSFVRGGMANGRIAPFFIFRFIYFELDSMLYVSIAVIDYTGS